MLRSWISSLGLRPGCADSGALLPVPAIFYGRRLCWTIYPFLHRVPITIATRLFWESLTRTMPVGLQLPGNRLSCLQASGGLAPETLL